MKTLVLSMISIAATVAAMTACTSESDPVNEVANNAEIKITASVLKAEVQSKAAVTGDALTGVQILRKDAKAAEESSAKWGTTPIEVDIVDASTNIFTDKKQYYKPTGENAYFIGFYPAGSVSAEGVVTFTSITGKEDVLLSNKYDAGVRGKATSSSSLTFSHQLALIKFTFKQGTGYPDGDQVTQLTVKGAELPVSMNVNDGVITYTSDKATSGISAFNTGTYEITKSGSTTGENDALMIQPGKTITLDIATTKGNFTVSNVAINGGASIEAGKQYNISITFNGAEAEAKATINDWGTVIEGSGTTE